MIVLVIKNIALCTDPSHRYLIFADSVLSLRIGLFVWQKCISYCNVIVLGTQTVNFVRFPLADLLCSDDIVLFIGTHFNLSKRKLNTALVQIIQ